MVSVEEARRRIILSSPHIVTPTSAALQNFSTDMVAPLKECKVHFSPVQAGSGDPSPTNVRPISGWTGVNVTRTGKNLFDGEAFANLVASNGGTLDTNAKTISYDGRTANATGVVFDKFDNGVYTCIIKGSSNYDDSPNLNMLMTYTDDTYRGFYLNLADTFDNGVYKFRSQSGKTVKNIQLKWMAGTATVHYDHIGIFKDNVLLSDYAPYTGLTLPIDLTSEAVEVYGGYADAATGEVVQTVLHRLIPGASYATNLRTNNSGLGYIIYRMGSIFGQNADTNKSAISNVFKYIEYTNIQTITTPWVFMLYNTYVILVGDNTLTSAEAWNNFYTQINYVKIAAHATSNIITSIAPVTLKTLRGTNNIWSDANGNIDISYWTH